MTLITNVLPKLRTRKEAVRWVSKKCRFTVSFDKQHGKGTQTHFKSSRGHRYNTYWSRIKILCLRKSLLLICKMLWLLINSFTVYEKYSPLHRDNFRKPIQMQFSQKTKKNFYFSAVLKCRLNFENFQKKVHHSWLMYSGNYGLAKRQLGNNLKSAISQNLSTSSMIKALRHIPKHHGGNFIILIDHLWGWKSYS